MSVTESAAFRMASMIGGYAMLRNAAVPDPAVALPHNSNVQRSALTDDRASIRVAVPLPHSHGGALERQDACEQSTSQSACCS